MSAQLRVAGWGTLDDGAAVTWTIAEGRRGRRWREVVAQGEAVRHSLLLETGSDGRFSHLELARAGGLWTFHPEADGTLHGNHVDPDGRMVRHVEGLPFAPDDLLVIEGSPLGAAALAWQLAGAVDAASTATCAGVVLRADGAIQAVASILVERLAKGVWRIGEGRPFEIDADGIPVLADREIRPLEVDRGPSPARPWTRCGQPSSEARTNPETRG
jgi:hypothetical protein